MRAGFAIVAVLALTACASTVRHTDPSGATTDVRVGFGNRVAIATYPPVTVEPAESVVAAGEKLGGRVVERASEAVLTRMVDAATTTAGR